MEVRRVASVFCVKLRRWVFVHSGAQSLTSGFLPRPACRSGRTLHLPGYFAPGYALCAKPAYSGVVHDLFRTPEALPFRARVPEAGLDPLDDRAALKFRHGAENRKNHLAGRRGRVELLG